jgi:glutamate formiminotransferase/formiminotetrahydrofolate cyclodeaminase
MAAFSLPKTTDAEKAARKHAINEATRQAIAIPFQVMHLCFESMETLKAMAEHGNPNSVSDAGVGALAARSGVLGAWLNVKINATGLDDKPYVEKILAEGATLVEKTHAVEKEILSIVEEKIS